MSKYENYSMTFVDKDDPENVLTFANIPEGIEVRCDQEWPDPATTFTLNESELLKLHDWIREIVKERTLLGGGK